MRTRHAVLALAPLGLTAAAAPVARGQSFQTSGTDFSPVNVGGKVVTNAHNDAVGTDTPNVRVSAYAFQSDAEDPNFTQDPGFNAPAGSGLPAGDVLSFSVLDSLKYWNGAGPVQLAAPAGGDSLQLSFATSSRTLTGTSGPQAGFNIGAVAANGALHKHLNAFLQDAAGNYDPSARPTPGIYVAQLRLNSTTLAGSDPIYAVYNNGLAQSYVDRTKFALRNFNAPGTNLVQTSTSMVGLSPRPGEANLATGGQVTVTGSNGAYTSEVDDLTANANRGSVVINHIGPEGPTLAMLYLSGAAADVSSLIANLAVPDYQIAASTAPPSDPLYADVQSLERQYPGFSALVEFPATANNGAFTWDFSANPSVVMDKFAAVSKATTAAAVNGQWAKATGGTWSAAANWANGAVPTSAGDTATFGNVLSAPATVSLDSNRTVGHLAFASPTAYTVGAGGGTLTLDNGPAGGADVTVTAGAHTVAAPVTLAAGATVDTASGTAVTFAGGIGGAGPLAKVGPGTLTLAAADTYAGGTAVTGGTAVLAAPSALPANAPLAVGAGATVRAAAHGTGPVVVVDVSALSLAGSAGAWTGQVDLADNAAIVRGGSVATLTSQAAQGFAGGTWAGTGGLVSGTAAADARHLTAVGVLQNATGGGAALYPTFDGRTVSAADVLVRYTDYGDADLNGGVNAADYLRVDAGFVGHLTGWGNGDFNYDGVVDGSDYALMDNAFNRQTAAVAADVVAAAPAVASAVPEPSVAALLVVSAGLSHRRAGRRRRA